MDNKFKSFDIGSTDDLIVSVIKDQASDLEHGWREGLSNSIDSPGSNNAYLFFNEERSIISDDGEGVDIEEEKDRKYLTDMGETSKETDSSESIGQFGIGKGQYIAKGRVTIISRGKALHYNIKEWGIENAVVQTSIDEAVEFTSEIDSSWGDHVGEGLEEHEKNGGLTVVISHYDDETPNYSWKWSDYEDNIKKRFLFTSLVTGVDVFVNGECISDEVIDYSILPSVSSIRFEELDDGCKVLMGVGHKSDGRISIYSNGVFVKEMERKGFEGFIVTDKNFDLNFARNEIKSGCKRWRNVAEIVDEVCIDICSKISGSNMNESARGFLVKKMTEDDSIFDEFKTKDVLKTANEDFVSVCNINSKDKIGLSNMGDKAADRLSEAYGDIILAKGDEAVSGIIDNIQFNQFDVKKRAHNLGLFDKSEVIPVEELRPLQKTKLGVARYMANKLGIGREIYYGKSSLSQAWTDGSSHIVITDSAAPSQKWIQWVPELYEILIHEWCHETSTKEDHPSHGRRFEQRYRKRTEKNKNTLSEIIGNIDERGVRNFRAR